MNKSVPILAVLITLIFSSNLNSQDCPSNNVTKNGSCLSVIYNTQEEAAAAIRGNETIVITNSTIAENGTYSAVSNCGGNRVTFAISGNCSCGGHNGTTNGTFEFTNTGLNCTYSAGGVLPVEYNYFEAIESGDFIRLEWETSIEINNKEFVVESSSDGKYFHAIGWISGNGTRNTASSYSFLDRNPFKGLNYYRLMQRDYDGLAKYSELIAFDHERKRDLLKAYFNEDGVLNLSGASSNEIVNVYSTSGKLIKSQTIVGDRQSLDLSSQPSGIYILNVISSSGREASLIVNKN